MRTLTAAALVAVLVLASAPAGAQDATTPRDIFRLQPRLGIQIFSYEEEEGPVESDYTSAGPAFGINAMLRFADRFRLTGDLLTSIIVEDEETWRNVDTDFGIGTQHNDLSVEFYVFEVDVGYSMVKLPGVEWVVVAGLHFYGQSFERSNFRLVTGSVIVGAPGLTVEEDVTGQGLKLGTIVETQVAPRLWFEGGLAWIYLYNVDVDNSLLGSIETDGYALRWRAGLDYVLTPRVSLGVGYEGHFIHIDRATSAIAILPKNMTWAHTIAARVGIRF